MGLQAGVFANECGMKLAGRAYQKAIPRVLFGSQYQDEPSEQVYRLAPKHRLLNKRRLSSHRFQEPLKRVLARDFRSHRSTAAARNNGAVSILRKSLNILSTIQHESPPIFSSTPALTSLRIHRVGVSIWATRLWHDTDQELYGGRAKPAE